mgnify:FL=1
MLFRSGNESFQATVLSNRATAYLKAKDFPSATADCDECLRLNSAYFKALRTRARVALATEDWEGALRDFKAAYELAPAGSADETGLKREVKDAEAKLKKSKMKDHYKTLNTHAEATEDEIKKAYRRASLIHHPDKGGSDEKFKEVGEAYAILSDPVRRRKFDAGIDESDPMSGMGSDFGDMGGFPGHSHGGGFGGGGGMNYEDVRFVPSGLARARADLCGLFDSSSAAVEVATDDRRTRTASRLLNLCADGECRSLGARFISELSRRPQARQATGT